MLAVELYHKLVESCPVSFSSTLGFGDNVDITIRSKSLILF